jgi:NhaA family Na+:H+ antiporter
VAAVVGVLATVVLQRLGVHQLLVYVMIGTAVWFALHEAGVHPTLAGVAMGLLAPVTPRVAPEFIDADELADVSSVEAARHTADIARSSVSTVEWLEHVLHPWSSYLIVPLFALANAGIVVSGSTLRTAFGSVIFWGIVVGLCVGKPLGVMVATKLAVRSGRADTPDGTTSRQLLGAGNAAGIGFTVALFIAELAFTDDTGAIDELQVADAKMAILLASVASGVVAWLVLRQRSRVDATKLS